MKKFMNLLLMLLPLLVLTGNMLNAEEKAISYEEFIFRLTDTERKVIDHLKTINKTGAGKEGRIEFHIMDDAIRKHFVSEDKKISVSYITLAYRPLPLTKTKKMKELNQLQFHIAACLQGLTRSLIEGDKRKLKRSAIQERLVEILNQNVKTIIPLVAKNIKAKGVFNKNLRKLFVAAKTWQALQMYLKAVKKYEVFDQSHKKEMKILSKCIPKEAKDRWLTSYRKWWAEYSSNTAYEVLLKSASKWEGVGLNNVTVRNFSSGRHDDHSEKAMEALLKDIDESIIKDVLTQTWNNKGQATEEQLKAYSVMRDVAFLAMFRRDADKAFKLFEEGLKLNDIVIGETLPLHANEHWQKYVWGNRKIILTEIYLGSDSNIKAFKKALNNKINDDKLDVGLRMKWKIIYTQYYPNNKGLRHTRLDKIKTKTGSVAWKLVQETREKQDSITCNKEQLLKILAK